MRRPRRANPGPGRCPRGRRPGEDGYVLALTAVLLLPLLAMAGLAVDVGSWYVRANRMQRAVDAAALAGVVWLPDAARASQEVVNVLNANGFRVDATNSSPSSDPNLKVTITAIGSQRLAVELTDNDVARYFTQLLPSGRTAMTITRTSYAEYLRAIPLGSPFARFGSDPVGGVLNNYWASVAGPYYDRLGGDPYGTLCYQKVDDGDPSTVLNRGNGPSSCVGNLPGGVNPDYRKSGYWFAIDVPEWAKSQSPPVTLTVEVYDAGNYDIGAGFTRSYTGNLDTDDLWSVNTQFILHDADGTPLDNYDNPRLTVCDDGRNGERTILDGANPELYLEKWYTLCAAPVGDVAGVFPFQVKTSDIAGVVDWGDGSNQFSVRATLSAPTPAGERGVQVYALNDMNVKANVPTTGGPGVASFYLASIAATNAGKKVQFSVFDPGDSSGPNGTFDLSIVAPAGSMSGSAPPSGAGVVPGCSYGERGKPKVTASPCTIRIKNAGSATGLYNGKWLEVEVTLPAGAGAYTCAGDCWWQSQLSFSGGDPTDRTVWAVRVSGDPVRLVG